jgi:uncharacterized membrane protein
MSRLMTFLRDRVIDGLIFLIPIVALLLLGRAILQFVRQLLGPFAERLPTAGLTGPVADYLVAAIVLLIAAFIAGLLASLQLVRRFSERIEQFALRRVPGYSILRSFFPKPDDTENLQVLLVTLDDAWLFGFLMETLPDGMLAVFVPGVPAPTAGSLYFFTEQQVKRTDIPVREAMRCLARLGVGSSRSVTGRLPTGA